MLTVKQPISLRAGKRYSESGEYISQIVNTWSIKAFISPVMGDMRRTDKQWIFI